MTSEPSPHPATGSAPRRTVRLAWAADVSAMAAIQLGALRDSLPAEIAGELDGDQLAQAWRRAVTSPPSARHRVLVATEDAGDAPGHGSSGHGGGGHGGGPTVIAAADLGTAGSARVVGFAATAPAEDPDAVAGTDGEVLALHTVREDDDLTGALLAAAADTLEADGFTRGQLWVGTTHDGVRRVAEGAGWVPDGAHRRLDLPGWDHGPEPAATPVGMSQVRLHTGLTDEPDPDHADAPATG